MQSEVGAGRAHDTEHADVETASAGYAARFAGPVGAWMLDVQAQGVLSLLRGAGPSLRVLEVGGGHGQLTGVLRRAGHGVVVHGSRLECHARLRDRDKDVPRVVSDLWRLPFGDRSFDAVISVRLLAHVTRWRPLLEEMARVSGRWILVDFPARTAVHHLAPALFGAKRRIERSTRPYFDYEPEEMGRAFEALGFRVAGRLGQFVLPMVLHRALGRPGISRTLEGWGDRLGLCDRIGSPILLLAERIDGARGAEGGERQS